MNSRRAQGALSILVGASIWGLFWIPLRHIDENGVTGLWAVALCMAAALIPAVPVAWRLGEFRGDQIGSVAVIGLGSGVSLTLYSLALIETDVIRAIFLFYALPIWTAIFGFVFLKERLSPSRVAAIATGLAGLWMLLGGGDGWPVPENRGDWFALAAGFLWGATIAVIKKREQTGAFANVSATFLIGTVFAIALAFALPGQRAQIPDMQAVTAVAVVGLGFGIVGFWPSAVGMFWGTRHVPATTSALLTMSEIIVGTISAVLLIGTSLDLLAMIGAAFIVLAVFIDLYGHRDDVVVLSNEEIPN